MRTMDLGGFSAKEPRGVVFPEGVVKGLRSHSKVVTGLLTPVCFVFGNRKAKGKTPTWKAAFSRVGRGLTSGQFPSEPKIFA